MRSRASVLALAAAFTAWNGAAAHAACSDNTPADGATVTCSAQGGPDTTGIQAEEARDVSVTVSGPGGGIRTDETSAIALGLFAKLKLASDAPIVSQVTAVAAAYGATIEGGNILASGKGSSGISAGDRLALTLGEKDSVASRGGTGVEAGSEATITVGGLVSASGPDDPDEAETASAIETREAARIVVTETGRIEASGIGVAGISTSVNSSVTVDGAVSASGGESIGIGGGIYMEQGATVKVGETGSVRSSGADAPAIGINGTDLPYDSELLASVDVAGRVEATGQGSHAIVLAATRGFFGSNIERPVAEVNVREGAVVSSRQGIAIFDKPSGRGLDVDTTVEVSGTVEATSADAIAIALSGGDDAVILLPTYAITGVVLASSTDAEGVVLNKEGESDAFVLDGDAGSAGRFDFAPGGEDRVLGFEQFAKYGAGLWTLSGGTSLVDLEGVVAEGELAVDTSIAGLDLTVGKGAVLSGTGTVGAITLREGGTAAPGRDSGTLTGRGDADLSEGTLLIHTGTSGPARLAVNGTAEIDGATLTLDAAPGDVARADGAVVLQASDGVSGRFGKLRDSLPDIDLAPVYGTGTVALGFTGAAAGSAVTQKAAYAETLSALLETDLGFAGLLRGLVSPLANLPDTPAAAAGGFSHGADLPAGFSAEPLPPRRPRAWIAGLGGRLDVDGAGSATGFDASAGGLAAGFDLSAPLGGGVFTVGLAAGYQSVDVDSGASDSDADIGRVGLYGAFLSGPLALDAALAYGRADIDTRRDLGFGTASSQADADLFSLSLAASYNLAPAFGLGPNTLLAPQATLDFASIRRDGFTEEGTDILDLSADSKSAQRGTAGIGLLIGTRMATRDGWTVAPQASLGYARLFGEQDLDVALEIASVGAGFEPEAAGVARDRLVLGADLAVENGRGLSLGIGYDGTVGSNFSSQTGSVSLGYRF